MPTSRSAKEICRDQGENSISCGIAKDREARRAREGRDAGTGGPPSAAPSSPSPPRSAPISPLDRGRSIEEQIKRAGG
jgi:hypothetical protein